MLLEFMIDTDYGGAREAAWLAANSLFGPVPNLEATFSRFAEGAA